MDVKSMTDIERMRMASSLNLMDISMLGLLTREMWRENCGAVYNTKKEMPVEWVDCKQCGEEKAQNHTNFYWNKTTGRFKVTCIICCRKMDKRAKRNKNIRDRAKRELEVKEFAEELLGGNDE